MKIAACVWGLPGDPVAAAGRMLALGYDAVDVDPGFSGLDRSMLEGTDLTVTCLAAGHLFPKGLALEAADDEARESAVARVKAGLREAVGSGAKFVYVAAPAEGPGNLDRFRESMVGLADVATELGRRLCIEPFPNSGLPSVAAMLDFLSETGRDDLHVLLDVGHCLIAGEDPAAAVRACGERLGYVHFDDNDGSGDLHLALTDGVLTVEATRDTLAAVAASPYDGPVAVEGHLNLPDPAEAMAQSLRILRDCDPA